MFANLKGLKTYIGVAAGGVLGLIVAWSPTDGVTWDTQWVQLAATAIGVWTGVAIRSAIGPPP